MERLSLHHPVPQLVAHHLALARRAAGRIYPRVRGLVGFDELCALANAGLAEAAERYDPARGATFATFAWYRIQGAIVDGLRRSTQRRAALAAAPPRMISLDTLRDRGFDAAGDAPGPGDDLDRARRTARLRAAIAASSFSPSRVNSATAQPTREPDGPRRACCRFCSNLASTRQFDAGPTERRGVAP